MQSNMSNDVAFMNPSMRRSGGATLEALAQHWLNYKSYGRRRGIVIARLFLYFPIKINNFRFTQPP